MLLDKVTIQISKATNGGDYVQVMSGDMVSLNVVVVADEVIVRDDRPTPEASR